MRESRYLFSYNNSKKFSKSWNKIKLHLFMDVLPTFIMIAIVGGLTLKLVEYIEQHRPNQTIVLIAEK